ncbi:MAG TPA: AraC family transcriptional regulator [Polyangiaceae bacterium]|nr:AraC family transcriptional regulator [Polyangiaceae bacterium]
MDRATPREPTAPKYGVPLTGDTWMGWTIREGAFAPTGKLEGLEAEDDAVLVWVGGKSEVTLQPGIQHQKKRVRFMRQSGMIDLLPRGTSFDEVTWRGEASTCTSVGFNAAKVERVLGRKITLDPERLRTAVTDAHVVDLVQRLQAQARLGQPWGSLYVEGLSLTLASYVFGRYGPAEKLRDDGRSLTPLQWEQLVAFVEDHLGDNLSLPHLASLVGYSADHFARLFKRAFRLSPYQYILERRVERAKSMLRGRAHSIAEVAVICGFASQAHLHAAFRARTGLTPGAFRRS